MGKSENDTTKELWICKSGHQYCPAAKTCAVTFNGKTFGCSFILIVPDNFGPSSSLIPSESSLGTGFDCGVRRRIEELQKLIDEGALPPDFSFEEVKQDAASFKATTEKERITRR